MVPEQNYEETDRLEMLLLRQDVLSDFLLDTWKADFKTSSKWRAIPNVDPHSLAEEVAYKLISYKQSFPKSRFLTKSRAPGLKLF